MTRDRTDDWPAPPPPPPKGHWTTHTSFELSNVKTFFFFFSVRSSFFWNHIFRRFITTGNIGKYYTVHAVPFPLVIIYRINQTVLVVMTLFAIREPKYVYYIYTLSKWIDFESPGTLLGRKSFEQNRYKSYSPRKNRYDRTFGTQSMKYNLINGR